MHKNNIHVTTVNTGTNTMTGGKSQKAKEFIGNETFMLTYGDGVADININNLIDFHKSHEENGYCYCCSPYCKIWRTRNRK